MSEENPKIWRRFTVGLILAGLHTAFFLLCLFLFNQGTDPNRGMIFILLYTLDHPVSPLFDSHILGFDLDLPVFGGLLWFGYGWVFQSVFWFNKSHGLRWLIASITFLAGLILLAFD